MSGDPFANPLWRESTHPASLDEDQFWAQIELTRGRSSGPGGQHRNRVATLVELRHRPTGLAAHAGERRSPEDNRRVAIRRLRLKLAVEHRTEVPAGEARTALWSRRCDSNGRIICADRHPDFPAIVAEALDVIEACSWDLGTAAVRLCCSQSQLVRLLSKHPPALASLNGERAKRGLRQLRPR